MRLLLVYLVLYVFPFPLNYIPFGIGKFLSEGISSFWQWITPPVAKFFFGYSGELNFWGRGSGDTLYAYYLVFSRLLISFLLTTTWLTFDKLKGRDKFYLPTIIIVLRYYLAFTLFTYGFSKLFYLQFPELNLMNLTMTYGDSSPMGLLWKFMGYSEAYSIFTGLMELIGGSLLLFRKTKILGGLLTLAIMFNVFMLNMSFDVPVKLYSFHLCIITLVILIPDHRNIWRFFVLNRPTQPAILNKYFSKKEKNWMGLAFKILLIVHVIYTNINGKLQAQTLYGKGVPKHELYGIYDVQNYVVNSDTMPPLTTDTLRWKTLIIDKKNSLIIKMNDQRIGTEHKIDSLRKSIHLKPFLNKYDEYEFNYTFKDSVLILGSIHEGDTMTINFGKRNREDFFLINRGFHLINEYPMQR